jgi:phage baseplate assembly protein W
MMLNPPTPRPPLGWPLLPVPDAAGRLEFPALAESVRQNLQVILSTRPGEQLMHPGYGAGLVQFIGEPNTIATRQRIHHRVTEAIGRWEPRIEIDRVDVVDEADRPGHVRLHLAYRLRRTGEPRTLGINLRLAS